MLVGYFSTKTSSLFINGWDSHSALSVNFLSSLKIAKERGKNGLETLASYWMDFSLWEEWKLVSHCIVKNWMQIILLISFFLSFFHHGTYYVQSYAHSSIINKDLLIILAVPGDFLRVFAPPFALHLMLSLSHHQKYLLLPFHILIVYFSN